MEELKKEMEKKIKVMEWVKSKYDDDDVEHISTCERWISEYKIVLKYISQFQRGLK